MHVDGRYIDVNRGDIDTDLRLADRNLWRGHIDRRHVYVHDHGLSRSGGLACLRKHGIDSSVTVHRYRRRQCFRNRFTGFIRPEAEHIS